MNCYMFKTALMAGILWTALTTTASAYTSHLLNQTHCTAKGIVYFYSVDEHDIFKTYYSNLIPGWEVYYRPTERAYPVRITGYCQDKPEVRFKPYTFFGLIPHWWFVIEETPGGPVIRPSGPWAKVNDY